MNLSEQNSSPNTVLIIDGHSWMHRAFHAMAHPLTAPDGSPTNAVFGFLSMLVKTLKLLNPDGLVVAFDDGKPTARIEALAQYKIQRKPTDPDLKAQFPIIKELLGAMKVPVACVPHIEGDDILGTLSRQGEALGMQVFLATSDRDAYQLITEKVKVISAGRGSDGPRIIGPAEVEERFGIKPCQIIDFLGLKGDPSDNIPGVPGVGEKTAAKLLAQYGTFDAVLDAAAAGQVKGKVGQNLAEHRGCAEVSRFVATIVCDVPLDVDLSSVRFGDYSLDDIREPFMKYGLKSPLGWMAALSHLDAGQAGAGGVAGAAAGVGATAGTGAGLEAQPADAVDQKSTVQDEGFDSPYQGVIVDVAGQTLFDTEELLVVSGPEDKLAGDAGSQEAQIVQAADVNKDLAALITKVCAAERADAPKLAAPDLKELFERVIPPDTSREALLEPQDLCATQMFDLSIAAYLLASYKTDFSLKELALEYLGVELDHETAATATAATADDDSAQSPCELATQKAQLCARLAAVLTRRLETDGSLKLYQDIELPLIPVLVRMERAGIKVDLERLAQLADYGRERIEALRAEVFELAGTDDFNPDSPKQLAEILFDRLGLPVIKKTKGAARSTNAAVLAELRAHHPIAEKITEYREFTKLQNTYLEALPKLVAADGRIHTSFNQAVAATGRLSSSNPNLQNIPVRTEVGRRIRKAFVPADGCKLLSADYSQIELRVLAQLSQDAGLIEAFKTGEDFHTETAARIFGLTPQEALSAESSLRSKAKAVNFGIIYGQGPHGLGQALDISYGEAKDIIDRYYATFPGVKTYLDRVVEEAKEQGWVETYYGRKRRIPELKSSNRALRAFGERTAMNHPMQGTAADLIKLAMIVVDRHLRESGLAAQMILQVHDELVFEVPVAELDQLSQLVVHAMTEVAPDFAVPLEVHVDVGDTWS
ncbi:MAG: DNA polymerase I [Coriobacteriia bacterium]|nr:DNA polymerase I [Coriobacteriia bacterium]MCL2537651.1 DNA polymerase I [Coriobacteriia bacterium]